MYPSFYDVHAATILFFNIISIYSQICSLHLKVKYKLIKTLTTYVCFKEIGSNQRGQKLILWQ